MHLYVKFKEFILIKWHIIAQENGTMQIKKSFEITLKQTDFALKTRCHITPPLDKDTLLMMKHIILCVIKNNLNIIKSIPNVTFKKISLNAQP